MVRALRSSIFDTSFPGLEYPNASSQIEIPDSLAISVKLYAKLQAYNRTSAPHSIHALMDNPSA
jgi:hypothetical protein